MIIKTPRLVSVAKELNVSTNTLLDFLVSKSFNCDNFKVATKLSEEMYHLLQLQFQPDKIARQQTDQIILPKYDLEPDI